MSPWLLGLTVAVSWLGLVVHNYLESVDGSTFAVGIISLGLFIAWCTIKSRRILMVRLLLFIALTQLLGAAVTVMPLSFLPFTPSQTLEHYTLHVFYGGSQLPLIGMMIKQLRPKGSTSRLLGIELLQEGPNVLPSQIRCRQDACS